MEEIKVGEYVRTDNGIIGKYVKYRGFQDTIETNNKWIGFDIEKDIVKHSKDIIDLIEVGDIVKYKIKVSTTLETKGYIEGITDITDEEHLQSIKDDENYQVLEVLTKEQYNSNCFKVKEKVCQENK